MCCLYNLFKENFYNTVFIDESTVQMNKNGPRTWFKLLPHENAFGVVGKYKSVGKVSYFV